jgi:hypothetical protein
MLLSRSLFTYFLIAIGIIALFCFIYDTDEFAKHLADRALNQQHNSLSLQKWLKQFQKQECGTSNKVLFGIFSVSKNKKIRDVIRKQISCWRNNNEHYDYVFVLGKPQSEMEEIILNMEMEDYKDILVLDCKENMNEGKSFEFFDTVLQKYPCHRFYAKVDEDTAFNPDRIARVLLSMDNDNDAIYFGRGIDRSSEVFFVKSLIYFRYFWKNLRWYWQTNLYYAGMIYAINRESCKRLVSMSPVERWGDEDVRTGYWMKIIKARFIDAGTTFHDIETYKSLPGTSHWRQPITNSSLAVHQCKTIPVLIKAFERMCAFASSK